MDILPFELGARSGTSARRPRFSIATLLTLIAVCAGCLAVWHVCFREAPTDKIPLYERARGTTLGSLTVGPNVIRLGLVARNDRDGSIHFEPERATSAGATSAIPQELKSASGWLDIVQVQLEPAELIDIMEARVFNHKTRELISEHGVPFGWRVTAPNIVQIYGLRKALPPKLDLWFRAHSYEADEQVVKLAPIAGSSCQLPGGVLAIEDIRAGSWSFNGQGFAEPLRPADRELSAILRWDGSVSDEKYQVVAVTTNSSRLHTEGFHFLRFSSRGDSRRFLNFPAPLAEIDHFELRPFGGRHTFFFDGVTLPVISTQAFAASPMALVQVNGNETSADLPAFAPLEINVEFTRGDSMNGIAAGNNRAAVIPEAHPKHLEEMFTLAFHLNGFAHLSPQFKFIDASGKLLMPAKLHYNSSEGSSAQSTAGFQSFFKHKLDDIRAVEITLPK